MNSCGGFATIAHSAHDQVGTAHKVAACEHAGHTRHLVVIDNNAAPFVDVDFVRIASVENRDGIESVGNQDDIDRQIKFGAGNWAWFETTFCVRFAQFHSHTARSANFAGGVP